MDGLILWISPVSRWMNGLAYFVIADKASRTDGLSVSKSWDNSCIISTASLQTSINFRCLEPARTQWDEVIAQWIAYWASGRVER